MVVVDDEEPALARRTAAHRLREAAGVMAARRKDAHPLDHVRPRALAHCAEHFGDADR
ncbi:MAG TPA: hypothetical protein VGM99_05410 [Candidatus Cybelea sp.]